MFSANTELHCWMEVPLTAIDSRFNAGELGASHGWCEVQPATGEDMPILGLIGEEIYNEHGISTVYHCPGIVSRHQGDESRGHIYPVTGLPPKARREPNLLGRLSLMYCYASVECREN